MQTNQEIKELVKEKYGQIAANSKSFNSSACCGATSSCGDVYNIMSDEYNKIAGYQPDADLGLGCGLPTEFAMIKKGDVVVDLGSGAGNDCFVARHETGDSGKVIGIDMTPEMIEKARNNAEKLGFNNVEFRLGEIESMPVTANSADVVLSNCVLNLVPDKAAAFLEINRILKPGGHFSISDIVLEGELHDKLKSAAEMYAGCVSGAIQKSEYMKLIERFGFTNIRIQKEKVIDIPDSILKEYLSEAELKSYKLNAPGIRSITVYAEKAACCTPGGSCC